MSFADARDWAGSSSDPHDEQFGDVVKSVTPETADDYDAVVDGEPYDSAIIGRPGAHEWPSALRTALASTKTHHLEIEPAGAVGDVGDVELPTNKSVRTVQSTVREEVVECTPPLEPVDRTARAGARAVAHALSGIARSAPATGDVTRTDGGDCR